MKSFKTYQKLLPFLIDYDALAKHGFSAPNSLKKYFCRFYIVIYNVLLFGWFVCTIILLAFEANTLKEYTDSVVILAAIVNDALILVSLRWKFKQCITLIKDCENMIEKSN